MNVDFIGIFLGNQAQESLIFSLDMPLSPFHLYNPSSPQDQNQELENISKKVQGIN
jgi:hypothetical protein